MSNNYTPKWLPALVVSAAVTLSSAACAQQQVSIHDPVMAKEGDTYYLFSTGPGITFYSSEDLQNWQHEGRVFATQPDWAKSVAPSFDGHLWAPDVIHHNDQYYLYYSVSEFGRNTSGIGVTVTPTLDQSSPDYNWVDQGIVIESVPNRDMWNAIDPNIIIDEDGVPWMNFGSFWGGMKLVKLNDSLTELAQPEEWYTIAKVDRPAFTPDTEAGPGEIEAPFIFRHDDYYYLFVSYGKCCRGADSTYHVAVGRSQDVRGPYLDKDGVDMNEGGGSVILEGNEDWYGAGHNSVYNFNGVDYLVFHAYEAADDGLQKLKIAQINWSDGWPEIDQSVLEEYQSRLISND
ncbi:arabinan endo-1,5-alpha-L-arabinosidase [Aliidiomarina soli]|uniref:Extracellular exo-alpha-(1->5)-L-arabinofuranosidase n=1 Tax=Aliidiomarina soli TaxID=1928574 RepID=A0A432WFG4_9GAMM|nr:arabinan endo-1,5-alpha-L-arabinosidase [Aliidiomarina soli]RUO32447.1 arabinan endo-1,5-alpha-L-arabinosidase [Aliidiomarina soli]